MARFDRRPPPVPPRDALARLIDGVQTLFREHLALAKAEIKDDVRRAGRSALLSAAGLPPLLVGYVLLMVAIALLLQLFLVGWVAFAIVALVNLATGAALTVAFGTRFRGNLDWPQPAASLGKGRGDGRSESTDGEPQARSARGGRDDDPERRAADRRTGRVGPALTRREHGGCDQGSGSDPRRHREGAAGDRAVDGRAAAGCR